MARASVLREFKFCMFRYNVGENCGPFDRDCTVEMELANRGRDCRFPCDDIIGWGPPLSFCGQ